MSILLTFLIVLAPFALAALLIRAAHRSGALRLHLDQFRWAGPMSGHLFDDRESYRAQHDLDAIRTRFENQPAWPTSGVLGERR